MRKYSAQALLDAVRLRRAGGGRKETITNAKYQQVAADLRAGTGVPLATANLNAERIAAGATHESELVCEDTVLRTAERRGGQVHNRSNQKTGKTDEKSDWAKARLALRTQL